MWWDVLVRRWDVVDVLLRDQQRGETSDVMKAAAN